MRSAWSQLSPKVILIEELVLCTLHQGLQGHPARVFALHLLQHARVAILHTTDVKAVQMGAFPLHDALHHRVELREGGRTGDLYPAPDRRLAPLQGHFDLIDNWRYG